jgi:AraC-like DNA-binding protein
MMRFDPIHAQSPGHFASRQAEAVRLLKGFEALLHCKVTVHDRAGLLTWHGIEPLLPSEYRIHRHSLCVYQRDSRPEWNARCNAHCLVAANSHVGLGDSFVHSCWKGGSELVVPVMQHARHVLTLFAGVSLGMAPTDPSASANRKLAAILLTLPRLRTEDLHEMKNLLQLLGGNLLQLAQQEEPSQSSYEAKIRFFLRNRSAERIGLNDLAKALHLSAGHCSKVVRAVLGKTFQEALREERLQRGAVLLRSHEYRVGEVARLVGFESEYHFNRKFRETYGLPPGIWRKKPGATDSNIPLNADGI